MYTNETNLQSTVNGLIEQRIKNQIKNLIEIKLEKVPIKTLDGKRYHLKSDISNFTEEVTSELSMLIIKHLIDKERAAYKIKRTLLHGKSTTFNQEDINNYVEKIIPDFKF